MVEYESGSSTPVITTLIPFLSTNRISSSEDDALTAALEGSDTSLAELNTSASTTTGKAAILSVPFSWTTKLPVQTDATFFPVLAISLLKINVLHIRSVYKELHADRETGC